MRFKALFPLMLGALLLAGPSVGSAQPLSRELIATGTTRTVKLYGAGGLGRLEGYGSGIFVSSKGHILTALSPLLDTNDISAVLPDGRKLKAELQGVDAERELAMLKVDTKGTPFFDITNAGKPGMGETVLAFSNLYQVAEGAEPVSVQKGVVSAYTKLEARAGFKKFSFPGKVYVVDAIINNSGAAGGPVTDTKGRLVGMIGKEVRNANTDTYVNWIIPVGQMEPFVTAVLTGNYNEDDFRPKPIKETLVDTRNADLRGMILVPEMLDRTPPFVDAVKPNSPASKAGLRPDDLILFVSEKLIHTVQDFKVALVQADKTKKIRVIVRRGQQLVDLDIDPSSSTK